MNIKYASTGILIFFFALTLGCAVVTTYGKKPQQDPSDKDFYSFRIYANAFAGGEHIRQYAIGQIEQFTAEKGYVCYQILERYMPTKVIQPFIYRVKFSKTPKDHMINIKRIIY